MKLINNKPRATLGVHYEKRANYPSQYLPDTRSN